jgi:hypothetical protein
MAQGRFCVHAIVGVRDEEVENKVLSCSKEQKMSARATEKQRVNLPSPVFPLNASQEITSTSGINAESFSLWLGNGCWDASLDKSIVGIEFERKSWTHMLKTMHPTPQSSHFRHIRFFIVHPEAAWGWASGAVNMWSVTT